MADGFYRLTYRDIAERLGISPDAARMKANRKAKAGHWRLLPDETPGQERLVEIPAADIDDAIAKIAKAERSAPVAQPEQAAPSASITPAERPAVPEQSTQTEPAESPAAAEHSASIEPFVPPKVTVSFDPQHPHLPAATTERSAPALSIASPEQPDPTEQARAAEQPGEAEQSPQAEQPTEAEQAEAAEPGEQVQGEQPTQAEQPVQPEQPEVRPLLRSVNDDLDEIPEGETGDALVSALTARVTKLTNRLLEETTAREKEREELNASSVREAELKVEIERLSARVAELTDQLEHPERPWWRRLFQGSTAD